MRDSRSPEERLQHWRAHGYFIVRSTSRCLGHTTTHMDGLLDPIRKSQARAGLVVPVEPTADVTMPGAQRIVLGSGDACVFHAWMIHRGSYTRVPARRTLDGFVIFGRQPARLVATP
jgi:hypothetical protein